MSEIQNEGPAGCAVPCCATLGLEFGRLARDAVHTAMRGYTGVCVGHGTWDMEHAHSEFGYDLLNSLLEGKTRIESYIDRDLNVFLSDYRKGQFTTSSWDSQIWRPPNVSVFFQLLSSEKKMFVDGHSQKEHDMKGITYTLPKADQNLKVERGAVCIKMVMSPS